MSVETTPKIISETLKLSIVTSGAYICSYLFERSFCVYYNIPPDYIEISVTSTVFFAAIFFLTVAGGSSVYLLVMDYVESKYPMNKTRHIPIIGGVIYAFVLSIVYYILGNFVWYVAILAGLVSTLMLFFTIHKLINVSGIDKERPGNILSQRLNNALKLYNIEYEFFLLLMAPILSYFLGYLKAICMTAFLCPLGSPNTVVIKKYGDYYFEAKYNPRTMFISDTLIISKMPDTTTSFRVTEIGHLIKRPEKVLSK